MSRVNYEQLLEALLGDGAELPSSPEAARVGRLLRTMLSALQAGPLPEVPPHLSLAARQVPESLVAKADAPPSSLRARLTELADHVLGRLVFDSARPTPALALRGPGPAARHLLYRFDDAGYELDLALIDPDTIVGQVLDTSAEPSALEDAVCVLVGDDGLRQAAVGRHGDFRFEGVGHRPTALLLETGTGRFVLEDLGLGAGTPTPTDEAP